MATPRKAAFLWSGGKDSALALHRVHQNHRDLQVVRLATCLSQAYDRVSMHGVRRELIRSQADSLGLPVEFIVIPSPQHPACPMAHTTPGTTFPPNDVYSRAMLDALARLKADGIEVIVFGDIFLEDLRAYRDRLLSEAGLEGRYPLWGGDTNELYSEFLLQGFEAVTVCVDAERLTEQHLGRRLDREFRDSLPTGVDPCGERGEYHSFVHAGPPFRRPVSFSLGDVHRHNPFAFQELHPGKGQASSPSRGELTVPVGSAGLIP